MNKALVDNASIDGRLAQKCFANTIHLVKTTHSHTLTWSPEGGQPLDLSTASYQPSVQQSHLLRKKKKCRKWWIGKSNSFYKEANSVSDRRLWLAIRDSNPSLATCWICSRVLPSSNPRLATLVNSQLNASCQLGFLIFLCCIWINHF